MRFDYFHALLVINIMLNLWFGTSVNHFYFRNRNVTILKYLDIQNHHFNLKLNINPYHLNSGENYLLSTCQQFIKSDPLFRLPSIFSHEKDYPFVFHTRMRNFQKKKCLANILQKVAILFNLAAFSLVGPYSGSLHRVDVSTPKNLKVVRYADPGKWFHSGFPPDPAFILMHLH